MRAQVLKVRIDNGNEFKNEKLQKFYEKLGIIHHTSIARTPQQNDVVKRRNCTLVEAARTMLIFLKSLKFLWDEAIATACFTKNRSIVTHGPGFNCLNFQDSSEDLNSIPSKEDLNNLFGPLYEEYYATRSPEVLDNFAANTLDNEDTPSSSSIIVEELK
nr:integrase, catalytic region, zinc finger, CCHC-type, peptidase aspartic, catalytic [Tanacetum cinerariifolium]